ncbi:hypothetical protein [Sphingosinicella sp. YJ22]|uniref:hypothetical protein n=1 Tax=Sphingosinicella sp. YJ22 TaxID=1104780 RepID=UPI001A9CB2AB|nr:hypothetical protein [Sphingosinicella sp. YJ22]
MHFFVVYAASIIFLTSDTTRAVTAVATAVCLLAAGALAIYGWAARVGTGETVGRWIHTIAALSGAAAFLALAWQGLPELLI